MIFCGLSGAASNNRILWSSKVLSRPCVKKRGKARKSIIYAEPFIDLDSKFAVNAVS